MAPVVSILSLAVHVAYAQSADPYSVVIAASRFESPSQDRPLTAEVITADDIRDSSATTVGEVLGKLGGIQTRINFTGIPDASLDLRGFGVTGDQNTLVLVNGQRLSENEGISARLSSIPLNAIERIEILRGSGAVLYGGGATGGTINIITRAPLEDGVVGAASMAVGSYDLQDLRASMQAKSGDWGLSLNGQKYQTDNYRFGNRAEFEAISGEIRRGDQKDFITLRFGADDQKSNLPGVRRINLFTGLNQFVTDPRGVTTPKDFLNSKTDFFAIQTERQIGDVVLALDVGRRNKHRKSFGTYEDNSGTNDADTRIGVTSVSPRLMWLAPVWGMKNALTLGADWSSWSYDNDTRGTGFAQSLVETGTQKNQAFYFRDELQLAAQTRLSVGIRQERVRQHNDYAGSDSWSTLVAQRSAEHRLSAHEILLQQGLSAGYSLYGRLGKSFRVANIDENRCDLYVGSCTSMLRPQTSRDQEVGALWQGQGSSVRAALFKMNITDEIHYNALTMTNMNLAPTERTGLEIDGKLAVGKQVDIGGRYTRTRARFKEGVYQGFETNDGSYTPFDVNLAGKEVPLVPRDRLSVNLNWRVSAATRLTFFVNHVGLQRYDNDQANNSKKMPTYTTADFKISHLVGPWRLSAGVNNLFDKAYYSYGVSNVSASAPLRYNVYPEARRNGYVSAEYRF